MTESSFPVFIGWSGDTSKAIALALRNWLPDVLQHVSPWCSPEDIAKGARWSPDLTTHLLEARFGIFCLTPENLQSLWIPFEAGCLSKDLSKDRICPLLFNVPTTLVPGPLVQFQVTEATETDLRKMVHSINQASELLGISDDRVNRAFLRYWLDLKGELERLQGLSVVAPPPAPSDTVLLSEILDTVRELSRRPVSPFAGRRQVGAPAATNLPDNVIQSKLARWNRAWTPDEIAIGLRALEDAIGAKPDPALIAVFKTATLNRPVAPGAPEALAAQLARAVTTDSERPESPSSN
jgi:hypothetical protein